MNAAMISPPGQPVDPGAQWVRLIVRERRAFRDFTRSKGDDERVEAYGQWIDAHQRMMETPAPDEAALTHKIRAFLTLADMRSGQGATDLSAICADLWRLADLELRPATAADWLDAFECFGGRWTIGPEGVSFVVQLAGCTDADAMMACRLERQLHENPALDAAVTGLILEGGE